MSTPRSNLEVLLTRLSPEGIRGLVEELPPSEVRVLAHVLIHKVEGLEALLRGTQSPNGHLESVGGSAGLPNTSAPARPESVEASGLPPDIAAALEISEAMRKVADQLRGAGDRLRATATRALVTRR